MWWKSRNALLAATALIAIIVNIALRASHAAPLHANLPLFLALALGGAPLLYDLARKILAGDFGADFLAGVSIVTAVWVGEYLVGALVVLMLTGGQALEDYATRRASRVLDALARRMPQIAHRQAELGIVDVALSDVAPGDCLIVLPHESCPVDGTVQHGEGTMDESYLTGEPYVVRKIPGSKVLSGAINGAGAITIVADKLAVDSRYARIMKVVQETETKRPRFRRVADRIGAWYTPLALLIAAAAWFLSGDPDRFLAVLVIATPCPLLLAIPVAIIGSVSLAAERGIIIKRPEVLERIPSCRTFIFDKTGTLTYGQPALTEILCAPLINRTELLGQVAALEQYSKHPLARAILAAAKTEGLAYPAIAHITENPGAGIVGTIEGHQLRITGRRKLTPSQQKTLPPEADGMESIVLRDDAFAAVFRFRDTPRAESHGFLAHLSPRHNVCKLMLVSGDRESEVRYLASIVGIKDVYFSTSPEQKVEIVRHETAAAPTAFLGDGINDAPAMLSATVGIAFGQNSDITSEAAHAVILEPSLRKVDELLHISRRMFRIAMQSAIGGMALSALGMLAAAGGWLPPIAGAVTQEIIDVLAVLNAVRAALPARELTDFTE